MLKLCDCHSDTASQILLYLRKIRNLLDLENSYSEDISALKMKYFSNQRNVSLNGDIRFVLENYFLNLQRYPLVGLSNAVLSILM